MTRPVIGCMYQPHQREARTAITYSSLRPSMDADAARLQTALLADASRRARAMRAARTDTYRRALAHRICTDLLRALRG